MFIVTVIKVNKGTACIYGNLPSPATGPQIPATNHLPSLFSNLVFVPDLAQW